MILSVCHEIPYCSFLVIETAYTLMHQKIACIQHVRKLTVFVFDWYFSTTDLYFDSS
jgi:hypothetical protein